MIGADPKFQTRERAGRVNSPGASGCAPARSGNRAGLSDGAGSPRLRFRAAVFRARPMRTRRQARARLPPMRRLRPKSLPATRSTTASRRRSSGIASPTANESLAQRQISDFAPARTAQKASPRPTASPRWRRNSLSAAAGERRPDHAGQHEILGLPLFRQQSAHPTRRSSTSPKAIAAAIAAMAAGSTGRTRPTTTTAC